MHTTIQSSAESQWKFYPHHPSSSEWNSFFAADCLGATHFFFFHEFCPLFMKQGKNPFGFHWKFSNESLDSICLAPILQKSMLYWEQGASYFWPNKWTVLLLFYMKTFCFDTGYALLKKMFHFCLEKGSLSLAFSPCLWSSKKQIDPSFLWRSIFTVQFLKCHSSNSKQLFD